MHLSSRSPGQADAIYKKFRRAQGDVGGKGRIDRRRAIDGASFKRGSNWWIPKRGVVRDNREVSLRLRKRLFRKRAGRQKGRVLQKRRMHQGVPGLDDTSK